MPANPFDLIATLRLSRRHALGWSAAGIVAGATGVLGMRVIARAQSPIANQAEGEFAGLVDIGGRLIYMESAGEGAPTVVLVAGALSRDVWSRDLLQPEGPRTMVFPAVAEFTHVIEYDRPGTIGEVNTSLEPTVRCSIPAAVTRSPSHGLGRRWSRSFTTCCKRPRSPVPMLLAGHSMGGLLFTALCDDLSRRGRGPGVGRRRTRRRSNRVQEDHDARAMGPI